MPAVTFISTRREALMVGILTFPMNVVFSKEISICHDDPFPAPLYHSSLSVDPLKYICVRSEVSNLEGYITSERVTDKSTTLAFLNNNAFVSPNFRADVLEFAFDKP